MPGYRSPSGRYVDWAALVHATRAARGRWIFGFPNAPATIVRDIRQQRPRALRQLGGELEAQARNVYLNPDTGTEYADVYTRWLDQPTPKERPVPKDRHDLSLTGATYSELEALASVLGMPERGGRSAAAAMVLAEYGAGTPRRTEPDPWNAARLRLFVDPEVWDAAVTRAEQEGVSIAAVLAEFAPKALDREREIRREGADLV